MNPAWAHGNAHTEEAAHVGWSFEPWVVIPILLIALFYAIGGRQLAARRRPGLRWDGVLFWCGLIVLALALMSPLHELGTKVFSAHMIEHELLMVIAAPLLVAAAPGGRLLWGLPPDLRYGAGRLINRRWVKRGWHHATEIWSAAALHSIVLWLWHVPQLFQATLTSEFVHVLQHLSFVGSALLFWVAVLRSERRPDERGKAAMALFLTSLQAGLLGALLTFSRSLWYPESADPYAWCGLTRLEDQALAGLIMWIPACTIYVVAALIILARWLIDLERRHA